MGGTQSCLRPKVANGVDQDVKVLLAITSPALADRRHKACKATSITASTAAGDAANTVSKNSFSKDSLQDSKVADGKGCSNPPAQPQQSNLCSKLEERASAGTDLGVQDKPWQAYNTHLHGPPRPPCDEERLEVTCQLASLLDAAPKKELENILQLVRGIFNVEAALIALFGDRRIYITNSTGGFKEGDFPWRWSFCGWTMASEQHSVMVINDAHLDARFAENQVANTFGVRFYCGAPLVSSSGHRLGTLCFADTQPRVFDTSSLQILCNFSELVTRELEKDIALAKQQAAQVRDVRQDKVVQYKLLLRTIDCVTSAVLLVDTTKPHWPILHANSGWGRVAEKCVRPHILHGLHNAQQHSHDKSSTTSSGQGFASGQDFAGSRYQGYFGGMDNRGNRATNSTSSSNSSSKHVMVQLPDGCTTSTTSNSSTAGGDVDQGKGGGRGDSGVIGQSLWSLIDPAVLAQIGSSSSSSSISGGGGWGPSEQLLQQVQGRQSFTLKGVKLSPELGGTMAQFTFRCAGCSTLDGAVSICLPTFAPDASELPAAAAALSAASGSDVKTTSTNGDSLYFVTVKIHALRNSNSGCLRTNSDASSIWTRPIGSSRSSNNDHSSINDHSSSSNVSRKLPALVQCNFPQFPDAPDGGLDLITEDTPATSSAAAAAAAAAAAPGTSGAGLLMMTSIAADAVSSASSAGSGISGPPDVTDEVAAVASHDSGGCSSNGSTAVKTSVSSFPVSNTTSAAAGLVCKKIAGLRLGGRIAAGSYGRVHRAEYFGSKVAVKVLDGHAVVRRDEATGFCLEALLSESLRHPNVVRTLAWAVVVGEGRLPEREKLWGETLNPSKPSIAQNRAQMVAAAGPPADTTTNYVIAPVTDRGMLSALPSALPSMNETEQMLQAQLMEDNADEDDNAAADDINGGQTWMVMEYCDKGCLQDAVERGWLRESRSRHGHINTLAVLATAAEIASGMAVLHQAGIIHGDLSAFNIMLSSNEHAASIAGRGFVAKVADFGLARTLIHGSKVITKTYGTLTHMPPEVLEHGVTSKAADVYSFGVLLWQMVSGSRAWAGMSHIAVVDAVCCKKQQLEFPEGAPEALVMLGKACMSYHPADRPSFDDVLEILAPLNAVLRATASGNKSSSPQDAMDGDDCSCHQLAEAGRRPAGNVGAPEHGVGVAAYLGELW